ncbi:MAG TPA: baseplate J/gp47 family protein [Lacibacter sp.]|nr:baseplate J/gp47 family protein [Lacibacter sp.]
MRDGTSQLQRRATVLLNKSYINIDEHSLEDLVTLAVDFAKELKFFDRTDTNTGNWQVFFSEGFDTKELRNAMLHHKNFNPQFALYLTFLKLFSYAQFELNKLTEAHLEFYYGHVLGLEKLTSRPDVVHLVYELAKGSAEFFSAKGMLFHAGKDPVTKAPLKYTANDDTLINNAAIAHIRTIYCSPVENDVVRFASVSNSPDGLGAKSDPLKPYWPAFGADHLPATSIGFAVASPLLLLKEGSREVTLTILLSGLLHSLETMSSITGENLQVFYTGRKNWIGPFQASVSFENDFNNGQQTITIKHTLSSEDEEVAAYNNAVHLQLFNTVWPVMQLKADTTAPGNLFGALRNTTVNHLKIAVKVNGVAGLKLENDHGVLDAKKPFHPFGPIPKTGSAFYVGYDEVLHKKMDSFSFDVSWLAPPQNFSSHYSNYKSPAPGVGGNTYFVADYFIKNARSRDGYTNLFHSTNAAADVTWPDITSPPPSLFDYGYRWMNLPFLSTYKTYHSLISNPNLFVAGILGFNASVIGAIGRKAILPVSPEKGFIRFELQRDFLHSHYPSQLAVAMSGPDAKDAAKLPLEPYTPTIKSIRFNYTASSADINPADERFEAFNRKEVQFFHVDVFGQAEQHGHLKAQTAAVFGPTVSVDKNIYLFPHHVNESSLLISLEKVQPGQSVSFLFQIAEGTANPEKEAVTVQWHALSNNEWRKIKQAEILKDETNHLLRSGIIRLVIPGEATTNNTILDAEKIWLCASVVKDADAVCRFQQITPQAITATFVTEDKQTEAHQSPAGTISKMVNKVAEVKKINQPFSSFGGRPVESKHDFYLRISERLRHKQRAVTNWDYEYLVLQQFPEVYKVKCLNHTSLQEGCECSFVKPGHVTLIAVPDIHNKNQFNPLEPKLSLDLITSIEEFLKELCSSFITPEVKNPQYEQVLLDFKVRFKTAGDFGFYADVLNRDIMNYLTPWAFTTGTDIVFGGHVRKSVLLNFIEEREYVDFVTDFRMYHVKEGSSSNDADEIVTFNPAAILVSHPSHLIHQWLETIVCI